jgi:hypothetical protein
MNPVLGGGINKRFRKYIPELVAHLLFCLVNLTANQVETLFGELEYIESRLMVLDVK